MLQKWHLVRKTEWAIESLKLKQPLRSSSLTISIALPCSPNKPKVPQPHHNPFTRGSSKMDPREKFVLRRYSIKSDQLLHRREGAS